MPGTLSPELEQEWPVWRLIIERVATMGELSGRDATYSLTDVYKANALLDMKADLNQPKESPTNDSP